VRLPEFNQYMSPGAIPAGINRLFENKIFNLIRSLVTKKEKAQAKAEVRKIRETVDRMIERKETKLFLVKHGFITEDGKLSKRYGG